MDAGKVFTFGGVGLVLVLFVILMIRSSGDQENPVIDRTEVEVVIDSTEVLIDTTTIE